MDEPILDSHFHVWRVAKTPWLQGPEVPRIFGAYGPIRRDYLMDEYLAEAVPCGVVGSIFVQANVAPNNEVEEAAWVADLAAQYGALAGISAYADLGAPASRPCWTR